MTEQTHNELTGLAAREQIGTTPAGASVSEEPVSVRAKTRWHKLTAFLVTVVALVAVAIVALKLGKDVTAIVYPSMAGALVTALIAYITGNVKEHQTQSAIGGIVSAAMGKLVAKK